MRHKFELIVTKHAVLMNNWTKVKTDTSETIDSSYTKRFCFILGSNVWKEQRILW
jgi:hypothetical protein